MSGIRIASRYAKSLLDLAIEKGEIERVFADMQTVSGVIAGNKDLSLLLSSPVVKSDKKNKILSDIFAGHLSAISMQFITLLVSKGREAFLNEVANSFVTQYKIYKNITVVELISAVPLDDATRQRALAAAASFATGTMELVERVDADLIGGFVLKVNDKQVDTSLSNKLRNLRREFSENPYIPELS